MKRVMTLCVLVLTLTMALCPAALAADLGSAATAAQVCYPTSISRSEDGTELKKIYDLGPGFPALILNRMASTIP